MVNISINSLDIYDNYAIQTKFVKNKDINSTFKNNNHFTLRLLHYNIRGLDKHFDELVLLITESYQNPDVIICSETRQLKSTNTLNIPGYTLNYNHGDITINDDLVVFVNKQIKRTCNIVNVSNVKCLNINIIIENHELFITCII